jgi:integrase
MTKKSGRAIHKLSAVGVSKESKPGYHSDGGGLYLQVSAGGSKSWIFRFKMSGRSREMGLGSVNTLTLADARDSATECRRAVRDGVDPIDARDAAKQQAKAAAALAKAATVTFDHCAAAYIYAKRSEWTNAKHASQWETTLATYASPVIGALAVKDVDTGLVMRILEPMWKEKPETASRLRGRIELVLGWATTRGYRSGENPARWRGHLENLLAKRSKVRAVEHHAALPYAEIGTFVSELRAQNEIAARALEFVILTAARSGEVLRALRSEIDLDGKVWVVPAERMKMKKEHRVPLSPAAIELIKALPKLEGNDYLFPGGPKRPLYEAAMLRLLDRMKRGDVTVHGFRSTFRDWAAEETNFPKEIAEMALAHTVGNAVENAYRRGDLFLKRARFMDAWSKFCSTPSKSGNNVIPINESVTAAGR